MIFGNCPTPLIRFGGICGERKKIPGYGATVVVRGNCKLRLNRFRAVAHEHDIEKCVIRLPYGVWSIGFATVNQIKSICIKPFVRSCASINRSFGNSRTLAYSVIWNRCQRF